MVAYYSELLSGNTDELAKTKFLYPYLNINDARELTKGLYRYLKKFFDGISKREVEKAVDAGLDAYDAWMADLRREGRRALSFARSEGIFIENVYTSKVLVGMMDWIEQEKVSGPVCYLHTGGLGSLFAQY